MVAPFLWAGQKRQHARVKLSTVALERDQGGLGLMSIRLQVRALEGKVILWAISGEAHSLHF